MPLHLHPVLSLPALAGVAAEILRDPPPGDDPFATDVLVVGGRGVEQWLRLALAERLPIVANLAIRSPSRFVQDLVRWATGEVPASASALAFDVLAAVHRDPGLLPPELRHLHDGDDAATGARAPANRAEGTPAVGTLLANWATRMARTFERYQLHRHDWLLAWERGDAPTDWQARLWRAVVAGAARATAPAAAHEATRQALMSRRAMAPSANAAHPHASGGDAPTATTLEPRWLLVHQGRLSPTHLDLVRALATHHDVHLLVHAATQPALQLLAAPDAEATGTLHAVAARLDRARVDALRLTHRELGAVARVSLPPAEAERTPDTLLAAMQRAVQQGGDAHDAAEPFTPRAGDAHDVAEPFTPRAGDASLRVLACHGALRQVEVLKDALLGALNDDKTLEPRDILVLTPDPARFVPLLQALLPLGGERGPGATADAPPPLLLHVQGRSPRAINPVADVLLQLLALAETRVSASRVLALVERGPVAERFGIASTDAPLVREWFQAAGVRWGLDADDPERSGLGLGDEGTWARALRRVLLGTALLDAGDHADTHSAGLAPVPGLEGERVLLAGRAVRAVRLLLGFVAEARAPRSLAAWSHFVDGALATLVSPDGAYATGVTRVREAMQALGELAAGPAHGAGALAALLEHRLEDVLVAPGRLGGITVAPLTAGWVRPARVIALLGMDDELFPRRAGTPWFDRLAESPRPGDPDERGEQLQTVFDALCMAQDRLLVTYTGWNRAGTMRLPPSVAVAALADVAHAIVPHADGDAPSDTWRRHVERDVPLQPFSRRAFAGEAPSGDAAHVEGRREAIEPASDVAASDVPSFDGLAARTAARLLSRERAAPASTRRPTSDTGARHRRTVLPLATLLRFLTRPAEEILGRLGVRLDGDATLVEDVLSLTMPRYDEAGVVADLADTLLLDEPIEARFDALQHRDAMPPAVLGRAWRHHATERARQLATRARRALDEAPRRPRTVLRVDVGGTVLTGTIDRRHGTQLLFLRDGLHRPERLITPFVTLCAAAVDDASLTHAVQVDGDTITRLACPADPLACLRDLVSLYHDADRAVPPYVPRTAWTYANVYYGALAARAASDGATAVPSRRSPRDADAHEAALEKAQEVWAPDDPRDEGEGDEPANRLLHATSPVLHESFATVADAVFAPVLAAMEGP